jgi:ABC-2 type transport system permease protein
MLSRRDLAVKYQSSALGYLWSLLEPLLQALVYWFVFGVLYHSNRDLIDPVTGHKLDVGYPLYIVSSIFAWMWFSSGINESTHALSSQSSLITTLQVRREIFPLSRVTSRAAEFLAGIPVIAVFALIFNGSFTWRLALYPMVFAIEGTLLVGVSLILAPLNVLYRDIERMTRVAVRLLMYSAPVIYPLSRVFTPSVPHWVSTVYKLNPLVGIVELNHGMWIPALMPSWHVILTAVCGSVIVFMFGWWVFRRFESAVLKEL